MDDADRSCAARARNRVLVVDVDGSHVKLLVTGADERRKFSSGSGLGPEKMVGETRSCTRDWNYDAVSIGYPGPVLRGSILSEPHNLGCGWVKMRTWS